MPRRQEAPLEGLPGGYLAWHEWAEKKAKTHDQARCPTCGFFAVWVPKPEGLESDG